MSSAPQTPPQGTTNQQQQSPSTTTTNTLQTAVLDLSEALDGFIADIETKFARVNADLVAKLDELSERSDRVESEVSEMGRELEGWRSGKIVGGQQQAQ